MSRDLDDVERTFQAEPGVLRWDLAWQIQETARRPLCLEPREPRAGAPESSGL